MSCWTRLADKLRAIEISPPLLHFGNPIEEREKEKAEAATEEDEGTGPQILVNGKPAIPKLASEHAQHSEEDHDGDKLLGVALGLQPVARKDTDECGGYGRNRMDDSLGIAGAVVQMAHEEFAVEPGGKILDLIHERDVAAGNANPPNKCFGVVAMGSVLAALVCQSTLTMHFAAKLFEEIENEADLAD